MAGGWRVSANHPMAIGKLPLVSRRPATAFWQPATGIPRHTEPGLRGRARL